MKQVVLQPATGSLNRVEASAESLALGFVTLIPQMMGVLRRHLRAGPQLELRPGQFRMLLLLQMFGPASLSDVADRLGLTLPSASKLAEELGKLGFIARRTDQADRRRIVLSLTPSGRSALEAVQREAQRHLAELFEPLTAAERKFLACAVSVMRPLFAAKPGAAISAASGVRTVTKKPVRKKLQNHQKVTV
ncbi:MAG: MarR family winged helix-turn-helix transcriptional regulator [Phycisphaerae bacterium]